MKKSGLGSRILRIVFVILSLNALLFMLIPAVQAETREANISQLLNNGNQFYSQGNYKAAIEQYERLVQLPFSNEVVYYNLGNAYFKNNQLGNAILNFEKAFKLAPLDRDVSANLDLARSRIADKIEGRQENILLKPFRKMVLFIPLDAETILVLLLFIAANVSFTLFLLSRSTPLSRWAILCAGGLFVCSCILGVSNALRIYQAETLREGVVLVDKVDVVSGPAADNPVLFSIHEGLKIRIENDLESWLHISLENGWNGWVKKNAVGMI
jgi:tetratricopeptide (TPR) repeat protein